jgi:hypothetical protein
MSRLIFASVALLVVAAAGVNGANAAENEAGGLKEQLLIVDRNSGHVVYDDGRNDLFCVTQRFKVGYAESGRALYRRTMSCR